jgi:glycosidase
VTKNNKAYLGWLAPLVLGWAAAWPHAAIAAPPGLKLHVPSPDWRDQVIYFVLTDRFADGNPANNDQGAGEYRPGDTTRYQGGDLAGLRQRLGYIQGLGATAVWLTPPVANQWLAPGSGSDIPSVGYHGYWAQHFMQVDKHLGSLADYQRLASALHRRGMYLVQDVVVNHTGNYFSYGSAWTAGDATTGYVPHTATAPVPRPSQAPFNLNDPRLPQHRAAGIYHWTPDVRDYTNAQQEHTFQMSGLDDLNTSNPVVRRALRRSYGYWIKQVGVDAFRVDTAFYVPPAYFADFMHSSDRAAPGMARVARATGRRSFAVFGEGFGIDLPGQDLQATKIESYVSPAAGAPTGQGLLTGMLNFPLYGAVGDVFARGHPPAELADRIQRMVRLHRNPHAMANFVDNHDVDRFLAGGSTPALQQALLAVFTLPGMPVIYYGTEQGFSQQRAAMFAGGVGADGRLNTQDHLDTQAPLYRAIAGMATLRRQHRVLSRGWPRVLQADADSPGVLAWAMQMRPASPKPARMPSRNQQPAALVLFNTSAARTAQAEVPTPWPAGTVLRGALKLQSGAPGLPADVVVGAGGRVQLALAPHSGQVWTLHEQPAKALTQPQPQPQQWLSTSAAPAWQLLADLPDPAGDDVGPDPTQPYQYPSDPSYGQRHLMDLRRVRVSTAASTAGAALKLDVQMSDISTVWNPANGFDHVAFTVFVELPEPPAGAASAAYPTSATVMPQQNASLPAGMRWHLRLRVHGWSNALFSAVGANESNEGTPVVPGARVAVDVATRTVSFTLPGAALAGSAGAPINLAGAKVYVTTWDYDGGYRAIGPVAQPYAMGGGAPTAPKVMDASEVIVLPR